MSNAHQLVGNAAENFDRFVRILMASFVDPILRRANLEEGKSVLDIGSGTGFFTREARKQVGPTGTTIGLDPDKNMLEVARSLSLLMTTCRLNGVRLPSMTCRLLT